MEVSGQKLAKADELFFVVDENDRPLNPLPRNLVHGHGVWHRVAHIWLINDRNEILCQQRSFDKENNPGFWESFFGGHMGPDESYEMAAKRELHEELGIDMDISAFKPYKIYKYADPSGYNNEFQAIFVVSWNGNETELRFQDGEVAQVAWKSIRDIRKEIVKQKEVNWTFCGYELEVLDFLGRQRHQ